MEVPIITRAAALASGVAVALETKGTVREARGFASSTYRTSEVMAYCTLRRPCTPTPLAIASVDRRIRSIISRPSVIGGSAHEESPE